MERKSAFAMIGIVTASLGLAACATDGGGGGGMYITRAAVAANGGVQLKSSEIRQALSGATIAGPGHSSAFGNVDIEWKLTPDGTLAGTLARINILAGIYPQSGKWNVNDANQVCFEIGAGQTGAGGASMSPLSGCQDWFRVGPTYYAFQGNTGIRRTVTR